MSKIVAVMHEHVGKQLRRIEIRSLEVMESKYSLHIKAEAVRQHKYGKPHYKINDYKIFSYRG